VSWNDPNKIFRCDVCDEDVKQKDILRAPNPFDADDIVSGCPHCKSVYGEGSFTEICEVEGCGKPATCGKPLRNGGYLRGCFKHYEEAK
jgi:hypothetical protein